MATDHVKVVEPILEEYLCNTPHAPAEVEYKMFTELQTVHSFLHSFISFISASTAFCWGLASSSV